MEDAVQLGMRVIKIPVYTELELPIHFFAEEPGIFVEKYGPVQFAITQRGVGRAPLEKLGHELAMRAGGTHVFAVGTIPCRCALRLWQ
jgi:hypothetical protein